MNGISFAFKGKTLTIPASRAFAVGEQIEDIVALTDIASWAQRPKMFKLARCFGILLREAGVKITDEDVHAAIMGRDGDETGLCGRCRRILAAVAG